MSVESKTHGEAWIGRMGSIGKGIIALLGLILGSGVVYFLYDNFVNVPDVTYTVLPSYELDAASQLGLVVVENRGRATAHDVLVRVYTLSSAIDYYIVESEELWTLAEGGAGDAYMVLWLDRMARGSSLTIFITTSPLGEVDGVTVTTEEGRGHVAGGQSIAVLGAPVALGAVLGALIASVVSYAFYSRLKSRLRESQSLVGGLSNAAAVQVKLTEEYKKSWEQSERELEEWRSGKRVPPAPKVSR
jgi:hypothetical protein